MEARARCVSLFSRCSSSLSLFYYLSLHLLLGTSLSFSSLFSVTRQHIYVHTLAYTLVSSISLSLSHPLPLTPLFFSFSSCFVLSLSLFPSHTSEKYSRGSSRSSSGSSSQIREREKEREGGGKSERNVERENDRRGERGRTEQVPARGGWGCRRARGSDLESGGSRREGDGGSLGGKGARGRENWNPE